MKAKSNKSTGTDMIPNEILKFDCVIQVLYDLFNICFDYGIIPDKWSESIISPIIKSINSDPRKPGNYRGISLLSSIAKLYGSVLNNRLMKYFDKCFYVKTRMDFVKTDHVWIIYVLFIL